MEHVEEPQGLLHNMTMSEVRAVMAVLAVLAHIISGPATCPQRMGTAEVIRWAVPL